jgi:hypothetical protein
MYPLIRDYFLNVLKFDKALVDDGNEQFVRLRKNLHAREVDIVAVKDPNAAKPRVDLVEAKAFAKGNSFEECFSQIDSIRDSGDRLWVAFPENQWNALALIDRRRNESRLNDFDFGLLLVSETECYAEIKAQPNRQVTETGRAEVLEQLGFPQDVFLPAVQTLGMPEAAKAAGIMGLICMVADIVNELEAKRSVDFQRYWGTEHDEKFISHGWYEPTPVFRTPTLWRDARPERSPGWLHDTRQSSASGRWS